MLILPGGRTAMLGAGKRRRKLGEVVAERIVDEIVRCGWKEGEVLGTEADFMERFRISRATFREAVRQLEWHGAAGLRSEERRVGQVGVRKRTLRWYRSHLN